MWLHTLFGRDVLYVRCSRAVVVLKRWQLSRNCTACTCCSGLHGWQHTRQHATQLNHVLLRPLHSAANSVTTPHFVRVC
jgi:hypothetical protein